MLHCRDGRPHLLHDYRLVGEGVARYRGETTAEIQKKKPTPATGLRFQELVYDLDIQVERLGREIGQLIKIFDVLSADPNDFHRVNHDLERRRR